jgi:hypothetical protein
MLDSVGSFAPDAFGYDLDGHRLGRAARMIRLSTTLLAALVLQASRLPFQHIAGEWFPTIVAILYYLIFQLLDALRQFSKGRKN